MHFRGVAQVSLNSNHVNIIGVAKLIQQAVFTDYLTFSAEVAFYSNRHLTY